ncbi:MAG: SusC/RagA family TonB-linked outer membrane protein [Carboxylicivirga sp.]|nr:SusC/RagA family TonB-linked outer membrane protein [Carboxylicivirga sp.]
MKLCTLFLVLSLTTISAKTFSQNEKYSLKLKNASVQQVLAEIQRCTNQAVFFSQDDINNEVVLNINIEDATLEEVLNESLKGTGLNYKLKHGTIVLFKEKDVSTQQESVRNIKGAVKDESGEPIPGANIIVKNAGIGTVSDINGYYQLTVPQSDDARFQIIEVSFIGMVTQSITITNQTEINITLVEETHDLADVVVTGYFQRSKNSFTGAVNQISSEELMRVAPNNVLEVLSAMDPAFQMIENNEMGSDPNNMPDFQLRGATNMNVEANFTGNPNQPLFVLDGFPVDMQRIFDMNPELISSITILKDATATAIYGSNAANGVVVVESKRPKAGKTNVSYTLNTTFSFADLSVYDLLNAEEKLELEQQTIHRYDGQIPSDYSDLQNIFNEKVALAAQGVDTDWLEVPVKDVALNTSHSLNINGGSGAFTYGMNLFHNADKGVMKGSGRDRNSIDLSLGYRKDKLNFRVNANFSKVNATNSPYGSYSKYADMNPYMPTHINGEIYDVYTTEHSETFRIVNPLYDAGLNTVDNSISQNTTINFNLDYNLTDDLRIVSSGTYRSSITEYNKFLPASHSSFSRALVEESDLNKDGSYDYTISKQESFIGRLMLNYYKTIGDNVISFNAGADINDSHTNTMGFQARGFPHEELDHIGFAFQYAQASSPSGEYLIQRAIGLVGSTNYSYKNKYLFDASVKYDGSSDYGANKRWAPFWALGAGWNIHNENFLKDSNSISRLKLRGSFGYTGSQNFSAYQAISTYEYIADYAYEGKMYGASLKSLANDDLQWQQTLKKNIGVDLGVIQDRINLSFDVYNETTESTIIDLPIAPSTGFGTIKSNLGEIENKGFEVSMNAMVIQKKDISLNLFASAGHNKNKLVKMNDALQAWNEEKDEEYENVVHGDDVVRNKPVVRFIEGESMSTLWAVKSLGIDPATGKELFLDRNGNVTDVWSVDNYTPAGDTRPDLRGSFGSYFQVKDWRFNLIFQYTMGADIYNTTLVDRVENVNMANNVDQRVFDSRWKNVGDQAQFKGINESSETRPTTRMIQEENTLTFTSLNVSYTFNQPWVKKAGLTNIRCGVYANDIFRLSTIKQERGTSYPFARSFTFNLTALF